MEAKNLNNGWSAAVRSFFAMRKQISLNLYHIF